jgi:hypothetical protein
MSSKTAACVPRLSELAKEVELLRSFLIGFVGKDKEGSYRPEFVRRILGLARESAQFTFTDKASFLSHLRKK